MRFLAKVEATSFDVSINGRVIKRVLEYKYLGVVLDENISWNSHVKYILRKTSKRVGMLGRIRNNVAMHTADLIYKSFILPIADYCDSAWSCCGKMNTELLEKLQRRAARIIMKKSSSDEALNSLAYDTLALRRNNHVSMDMYHIFLKTTLFLIKILSDVKRDRVICHIYLK